MVEKPTGRTVLKSSVTGSSIALTTAVSGVSGTPDDPGNGRQNGKKKGHNSNIELVDTHVRSESAAHEDAHAVLKDTDVQDLAGTIDEDSRFHLTDDGFVSIELETDDRKVNRRNPAVLYLPIQPDEGEYTPDNGGTLLVMVVDRGSNRIPVSALGITRERTSDGVTAQSDQQDVSVTAYGNDDGTPGIVDSTVDSVTQSNGVGTQAAHGAVGCTLCTTIIATACAGASKVSLSACAKAAISAGAFSPWAGGAASAFCLYVINNAGAVSCSLAPGTICIAAGICD